MPFFSYCVKLWRAFIKFEDKNRADGGGLFFLGWCNQELNAVPKKEPLTLYVGRREW